MSPDALVQQQEHRTYLQSIDDALIMTCDALSQLCTFMQQKSGEVHAKPFNTFYYGFKLLFSLTSSKKAMYESEGELIKQIEQWMSPTNPVTPKRVFVGEKLFNEWCRALEKHGVHTFGK